MLTDIFDYNEVQVLWHNSVKQSQYFNIWCFLSSRWPSFGSREIQMVRQHRWFNMYISVLKTTLANMQYLFTYFIWNCTCDHIPYEQHMYNYSRLSMEVGRQQQYDKVVCLHFTETLPGNIYVCLSNKLWRGGHYVNIAILKFLPKNNQNLCRFLHWKHSLFFYISAYGMWDKRTWDNTFVLKFTKTIFKYAFLSCIFVHSSFLDDTVNKIQPRLNER